MYPRLSSVFKTSHSAQVFGLFLAEIEREAEAFGKKVADVQQEFDETSKQLQERRQRLQECDGEIAAVMKEIEGLNKQLTDCNVERKKTEHKYVLYLSPNLCFLSSFD